MAKRKKSNDNLFEELEVETNEEKIEDTYISVIDEENLEAKGTQKIKKEIEPIEEIEELKEVSLEEEIEEIDFEDTNIEIVEKEEIEEKETIYKKTAKEATSLEEEIEENIVNEKKEKIKKIAFMGGVGAVLGYFAFFNEEDNTNKEVLNASQFKKKETSIQFEETLKLEEINKNEDFLKVLQQLKQKVEDLENISKEKNSVSVEELNKKQYENFKKIEDYIFKQKYNVGQFEYFEKKGSTIIHYINKDDIRQMNERIVIPFRDGMIIKIPEINTTYLLMRENNDQGNSNYFLNDFEIWKIDDKVGLKKVISTDEKKQTLIFLREERENKNFIYERFENKIVIIGKNLEVEERIDIVNISEGIQLEEPKNIKESYGLSGFIDQVYNKYEIKAGEIWKNGKRITKKDFKYDYKIKRYTTENLEEKWVLNKYQNGLLVGVENLEDIRKIYITNYKGKNQEGQDVEYLEKNKEIFKITKTQDLIKIGEGYIVGRIKDGNLTNVELDLYSEVYEPLNLSQFLNKTLVLTNKEEYKVMEEGLYHLGKLTPLKDVIIGSNEFLYINKKKIGKIEIIKFQGKTGVKVKTKDYNIIIRSEEDFEIRDRLTNDLKYSNDNLKGKKIKFLISKSDNKIKAVVNEDILVNFKDKTIDNIKYETYEQDVEGNYIIYNENGEKVKEVKKKKRTFLFEQSIEDFELTKGDLFDYFFELDNKTGEVSSDEIGSMIKKYDKNSIPFKGFKKQVAKKALINVTKGIDLSKSDLTPIKNILKINTSKFLFKTLLGKEFKILDENNYIFNGQKILFSKSFYNKNYNEFVMLLEEGRNNSRTLQRAGIDSNLDKVKIKIDKIDYEEKELINTNTNEVIMKYGKKYYYKGSDKFELVINIDFLFYDNKVSFMLETGEQKEMNLEDIKPLFDYLKDKYKKDLRIQLTPKIKKQYESDFEKVKKQILDEQKKSFVRSLKNAESELKELLKKEVKKEVLELTEEQIAEIQEEEVNGQEYDYMFEIGQKIKMTIKDSIELTEGETPFVLGYISNAELRDLNGNYLRIENAKVLTEIEGDFAKGKVFIKPVKIIYFHPELGKKVSIEIPNSATQFLYTERDKKTGETYQTVGIPGYVVRAKLKTLPTRVVLKTVGGAVENLTKSDDMMSSMTDIAAATSGSIAEATGTEGEESMGESAASGVSEGIKELVDTMTEIAEKEKDVIITEPDITGEFMFMEEVEVILEKDEKKNTNEQKVNPKDKLKEKFNFTRK